MNGNNSYSNTITVSVAVIAVDVAVVEVDGGVVVLLLVEVEAVQWRGSYMRQCI